MQKKWGVGKIWWDVRLICCGGLGLAHGVMCTVWCQLFFNEASNALFRLWLSCYVHVMTHAICNAKVLRLGL